MEDENGFVRVCADHYGPGEASYSLGMEMLMFLKHTERENPSHMKVEGVYYALQTQ